MEKLAIFVDMPDFNVSEYFDSAPGAADPFDPTMQIEKTGEVEQNRIDGLIDRLIAEKTSLKKRVEYSKIKRVPSTAVIERSVDNTPMVLVGDAGDEYEETIDLMSRMIDIDAEIEAYNKRMLRYESTLAAFNKGIVRTNLVKKDQKAFATKIAMVLLMKMDDALKKEVEEKKLVSFHDRYVFLLKDAKLKTIVKEKDLTKRIDAFLLRNPKQSDFNTSELRALVKDWRELYPLELLTAKPCTDLMNRIAEYIHTRFLEGNANVLVNEELEKMMKDLRAADSDYKNADFQLMMERVEEIHKMTENSTAIKQIATGSPCSWCGYFHTLPDGTSVKCKYIDDAIACSAYVEGQSRLEHGSVCTNPLCRTLPENRRNDYMHQNATRGRGNVNDYYRGNDRGRGSFRGNPQRGGNSNSFQHINRGGYQIGYPATRGSNTNTRYPTQNRGGYRGLNRGGGYVGNRGGSYGGNRGGNQMDFHAGQKRSFNSDNRVIEAESRLRQMDVERAAIANKLNQLKGTAGCKPSSFNGNDGGNGGPGSGSGNSGSGGNIGIGANNAQSSSTTSGGILRRLSGKSKGGNNDSIYSDGNPSISNQNDFEIQSNNESFIVDSGAVPHAMTRIPESSPISNVRNSNVSFSTATGEKSAIESILDSTTIIDGLRVQLKDIIISKTLSDNLISVGAFLESMDGYIIFSEKHVWWTKDLRSFEHYKEIARRVRGEYRTLAPGINQIGIPSSNTLYKISSKSEIRSLMTMMKTIMS